MRRITRFPILSTLLLSAAANAQPVKISTPGRAGMFAKEVQFEPGSLPAPRPGRLLVPDAQGRPVEITAIRQGAPVTDQLGQEHIRYQQTHNGIPVEHAITIVHTKGNQIFRQNGKAVSDFSASLPASPGISEPAALAAAMKAMGAEVFKWELPEEEAFLKAEQNDPSATFRPKGELVYYSGEADIDPSKLRLAYKFDVYAHKPLGREYIFVDAVTGDILGRRTRIMHTDAGGFAQTAYSGLRAIIADNNNGTYRLRESARGQGIMTLNMKGKGTVYANAVDFTDADNHWDNVNANKDQYAADAHWATERTYDYYMSKFARNSVDYAGFALKNYVHASLTAFGYASNVNAFWDGSRITYGDGDGGTVKPLTSVDIVAHEITHGMTDWTSKLIYANESGALNEGFSDIFGTCVEFYAKGGNWTIAEEIGTTFRSMSNPKSFSDPDTYKGSYWVSTAGTPMLSNDYNGVHNNSGVLNFWFYLLTVGGSGVNDNLVSFTVNGIGMDKAAQIAYRTNSTYLTPTSDFSDARIFSIRAAEDLFGAASNEVAQVINAWEAVGVTNSLPIACTDDFESNNTQATAASITMHTDVNAKISSATDVDYFKFTTTGADPRIRVFLNDLPADYDMALYNSNGTLLGTSVKGGTLPETITYNGSLNAGTYYVKVYGYNGANNSLCYTLHVSGQPTQWAGTGSAATSAPKQEVRDAATRTLNLYPVPAGREVHVAFQSEAEGDATITVTTITGSLVSRQQVRSVAGGNDHTVDVSALPDGVYLVQLTQDGRAEVQKLVVQH